jgi:hypothetical protein
VAAGESVADEEKGGFQIPANLGTVSAVYQLTVKNQRALSDVFQPIRLL